MFWETFEEIRETTTNDMSWTTAFNIGNEDILINSGLSETTYFSCLKIISETVAKCPIQIKQETEKGDIVEKTHYLTDLLRLRPNESMTAVDVIKTFVLMSKHHGLGGLYIDHKGSKVKGLYPVRVTGITIDNVGLIKSTKGNKILYDYVDVDGIAESCADKDIIILRDFTLDGINQKAISSVLRQSLDTSIKSQDYLNKLFSNGLTNKLVLQLVSDIKEENELKRIQTKFDRIFNSNGRLFTVPAGYNVSALNLSLADAQFAELRKMSKEDIAGAFGVPMSKLGIEKDNAKSDEQDNLSFLQDTLQVIFTNIEQEMDYKLLTKAERDKGYKIRFNTNVMLRMDAKTQAEVLTMYVKNGVYSLQKAQEILGINKLEGEDIITFPSGQVTLQQMLAGNTSYSTKPTDDTGGGE